MSASIPAPLQEVPTIDADVALVTGNHNSAAFSESEATRISPARCASEVFPEDSSATKSPKSTMIQGNSRANLNNGLEKAPGKRGNRQMQENVKPGTTGAVVTSPLNPPETQEQKLERLQKQEITKLGRKIRQQINEPTTSPHTLSLARQASSNLQATGAVNDTPKITAISPSATSHAHTIDVNAESALLSGPDVQAKAQDMRSGSRDHLVRPSTASAGGRGIGGAKNARKGRWATTTEIKPPPAVARSIDSNAFGSEVPSDGETASGDSVAALDNGRLVRKSRPAVPDAPLADWSGNWMPPPVDWDIRPRFSTTSIEYVEGFGNWNEMTAAQSLNVATGIPFTRLPIELVQNPELHPDGIDLVDPTMNVDEDTAVQYGYSGDALLTIKHDAKLIDPRIFVDDWGKLDLRDPDNRKFKNECCLDLLRNYNANIAKEREQEMSLRRAQKIARKREGPIIPTPNPHTPRINIYLRPSVRSDIPQMQDIYNSYLQNSVRGAELQPLTYNDMLNRWADTTDEKLPFIVAISKSTKINSGLGNAVEKIVGWASATDWVSRNAVERFTVELEIYVHQEHLHQGVGKCLMDKLIDSTDRGHIARKGYPFSCAPELRHGYSAGGARDLIKLLILVRSLDKPRNEKENDLPWIKKWLEDEWKFEQQGYFPHVGVKFKRL